MLPFFTPNGRVAPSSSPASASIPSSPPVLMRHNALPRQAERLEALPEFTLPEPALPVSNPPLARSLFFSLDQINQPSITQRLDSIINQSELSLGDQEKLRGCIDDYFLANHQDLNQLNLLRHVRRFVEDKNYPKIFDFESLEQITENSDSSSISMFA